MLLNHWNESLSAGMMQALNRIAVIVRRSRNEMTHQLWPYTPRKRTLGQCDYSHAVGGCIFAPSKAGLPLTDLRYITRSLYLKKHLIQGLKSILTVTVQWDSSSMLSQSLWFIQHVHSFTIDVKQHNELFEEGHTWTRSGNSYLSGSWTGKQPVLQPITWQEIPY